MQKLLPPVLVVLSAAVMVTLYRKAPGTSLLPQPANYVLGIPLIIVGLGMTLKAARRFRTLGANIHTFREPSLLVQDGLFALSRNPMYLGFALALAGFAIKLNALTPFAIVAAFVLVADRWYIRYEERMAAARFGQEYEAYRRRTRRWL